MKHLIDYKNKRDFQKGITLIALVITIIVLLILAIVSIKILIDQGIIGHAKNATDKYTIGKEKEFITIAYSNYQMQKFAATDTTELKKLQEYFSKPLQEIMSPEETDDGIPKFLNNEIIEDANTSLILIGVGFGEMDTHGSYLLSAYRLRYNNNIYRLIVDSNEENIERVEFESTITNTSEASKDIKLLNLYFNYVNNLKRNEDLWDDVGKLPNSEIIPDASTSVILVGEDFAGNKIVQYKNHFYKLIINSGETCFDNQTLENIELESVTFTTGLLEVQGAEEIEGDENQGWTITFKETGHVYTLLSNGVITGPTVQMQPTQPEDWYRLTDTEKAELEQYPKGEVWNEEMYIIAADNNMGIVKYSEIIIMKANEVSYVCFLSDSDNVVLEKYKWYKTTDMSFFKDAVEYTGKSPIEMSDFTDEKIYCKTYFQRVINSFQK